MKTTLYICIAFLLGAGCQRLRQPSLVIYCDDGRVIEPWLADSDGENLAYIEGNSFIKLKRKDCPKYRYE